MNKKPKYAYITVIQFRWDGLAWDDVCEYWTAEEKKNVRRDLNEYRMSGCGQYRAIKRRVPNE